ncbi:DNA polymerase III chi subunit, HolC [Moraxella macacae 0408225]|uniref:DNA polymerase III chi subunit, HolC n=1 Tax=Moraxella macacae 0408225 TaxID=1230338 RepID=L2F968_9GAMM|nr:DNA polymerase III subunit chi [Moraxella macacae]ELA09589.1 DNA polymerase III chi subunit, HolC [Moraxella macacae 0408225]
MQVNFYILSPQHQLMTFVCQLVQTILKKSSSNVLIFADSTELTMLDDRLWTMDPTAFIAHEIYQTDTTNRHTPPVLISDRQDFANQFDGILINLTAKALLHSNFEKLLEIIDPNPAKIEQGRQKYRQYQQYTQQINQQNSVNTTLTHITLQTFHIR